MGSGVLRARMSGESSYAAKVHGTSDRIRRSWRAELREVQRLELSVEDFSTRHLAHVVASESHSLKSWRTFHTAFVEDFGGMELRALTVSVWEAWLRARRMDRPALAERTLKVRLSLASSALRWACEIGALDENPIPRIAKALRPRPSRDRSKQRLGVLSISDIRRVLGVVERRAPWWEHWGYSVLVLTGGRFGEWAGARYGSLRLDLSPLPGVIFDHQWDTYRKERVDHTKDGAAKAVPLHRALLAGLTELPSRFRETFGRDITPEDPLCPFVPERGAVEVRTWNQRTALRRWKDFLDTVGVPPTAMGTRNLHHARHTLITRLRRARANPLAVRALTHPLTVEGHADSHSLYAHDLDWRALCEAIDCLDLTHDDDDHEGEQIALPWGE